MHKYLAGLTIAGAIAFIIFRVADDQLGVTVSIKKMISGT